MPTIFSHAVFAAVSGTAVLKKPVSAWFWLLTALCSIIPDADVIGLAFGIRYNHPLGHRGLTHSLLFAVFFGTLVAFFRAQIPGYRIIDD
jgi:inner membrane protein